MRNLAIAVSTVVAVLAASTPSGMAQGRAWCLLGKSVDGGAGGPFGTCTFHTEAQCRASASHSGICQPNPRFQQPGWSDDSQRKSRGQRY
jgi:hypothetical protein